MIVWRNGRLLLEKEVKISPFDPGLTVGEGVFETMLAVKGQVFAWERHQARLARSAETLRISIPQFTDFPMAIRDVLHANPECDDQARVRVTITAHGIVLVTARPIEEPALTTKVVHVDMPINERSPLAQAKTLSYAENLLALSVACEQGAQEAIRSNTLGELCEASLSNIFFVREDQIFTPSLDTGCLPGITREIILESYPEIQTGRWPLTILDDVQEIWLASSIRRLQWVSHLVDREFGPPSDQFQKIRAHLDDLISKETESLGGDCHP